MKIMILSLIVPFVVWFAPPQEKPAGDQESGLRTLAINRLPFCALILRNYLVDDENAPPRREIHVFMSPDDVSENSLRILFAELDREYQSPMFLEVSVYTDVEQLSVLATGISITKSPDPEGAYKKQYQRAYYRRTEEQELFRYNPDYPKRGMKTIVLRGRE